MDDDWDCDSPSWHWRAHRLLDMYGVSGYLPDTPSGFTRMPEGTLMVLTAWPEGFSVDDWRALTAAMVELAQMLSTPEMN